RNIHKCLILASSLLRRCLSSLSFCIRPSPSSTLFPTRRSSDLEAVLPALADGASHRLLGRLVGVRDHDPPSPNVRLAAFIEVTRSEEHTSELQSRFDLVCRLLLEKKKKKQNSAQYQISTTSTKT